MEPSRLPGKLQTEWNGMEWFETEQHMKIEME